MNFSPEVTVIRTMRASNSKIQCFKSCRRKYWLKYVEGLEYNKTINALERGKSYHAKIEELYNNGFFTPDENIKTNAMAAAYQKYIYPRFPVQAVEEWFDKDIDGHTLVGRIDGKTPDGELVEHKTTSAKIDEAYFFNLSFDEQILSYMLAKDTNGIYYTVCQTPTIRQRQNESEEDFQQRCIDWFDDDTDSKIRVVHITRQPKEIEEFKVATVGIMGEMEQCKLFYRNPGNCMRYGRMCEYAPICLEYDPKAEYVDFSKREEKKEKEVTEDAPF